MEIVRPHDLITRSGFRCDTLAATPNPNLLMYQALHQDYSSRYIGDYVPTYSDSEYGDLCVRRLLQGNKGHYGVLEHPQITIAFGNLPHCVIQQARTHRVGISFDVQSFRYTGVSIYDSVGQKIRARGYCPRDITERFIYLRPVGFYRDRSGKSYYYSEQWRNDDLDHAGYELIRYADRIERGMSEEHSRGMLPFDYRQHFVMSVSLRSALHFLDMRSPMDAQLEIRAMSELMFQEIKPWVPEVVEWYERNRLGKKNLSP